MSFDDAMLAIIIAGLLAYPGWFLIRWCRTIMGTWVEPLPPPDRSAVRKDEIDPEWEAEYGHVRHED